MTTLPGLGAVLFRDLIGFVQNVMFGRRVGAVRRQPVHATDPVGAAGQLGIGGGAAVGDVRVNNFAPEARRARRA